MLFFRSAILKATVAGVLVFGSQGCAKLPVEEIPVSANPSDEITKLEAQRAAAVAAQVDVLSPSYFEDGVASLEKAQKSRANAEDTAEILGHVAKGRANLTKATEVAAVAKTSLTTVVAARADALAAQAPKFLKAEFTEADDDLRKATRDIEKNDLASAANNRAPLTQRYAALELRAIKIDKLAAAAATIDKAEKEGAQEIAGRTFKEAKKALADADAFITKNRHDQAGIDAQAAAAKAGAERLLDVSRQVKVADKSDAESVVLDREAAQKKLDAEVAAGAATSAQLGTANAQLGTANAKSDALTAANSQVNAKLEQEKQADARLQAAKAKFSPAEADVYLDGDRLIIRMKTIAFPSGKANLPPESFPVLGKVQKVIQDLKAARVTVEGHTDANGSSAANTKLSNARASAIGGYLASSGYAAERISTVGYGDSKPLTSNKTEAGRAQNRRVDVIIEPSPTVQ